ncbi:MAG TPA: A24 family peptidase [Acetivibrio clariflavus]|nr:A24 family peptidase [Acetivibrio clariflavus]
MWILIALPLTLVLLALVHCYLQEDLILSRKNLRDKFAAFIPKKPIYILYLLCVFIAGIAVFGVQYRYFSDYIKAAKLTVLILLLAPVAYIDFKNRIIPDKVLLVALLLRIVFYLLEFFIGRKEIAEILVPDFKGVLLGSGVLMLGTLIAKDSIGIGDIKMYGIIGLFASYSGTSSSMILSLFICSFVSIILLVFKKKGRRDTLPLAPFALVGTFIATIIGSC